jgi:hypothetical protein
MSIRSGLWLVGVLIVVVARVAGLTAQAAGTVEEFVDPFVFSGINPCTNEEVYVSGETRVTVRVLVDPRGARHVTYTLVASHIRGEGENGTSYRMVGGERDHLNVIDGDPYPLDETFSSAITLVGSGKGANFTTHFTSHITITADGVTRSEVVHDHAECRG